EAGHGRERRLDAGVAALSLDRVHQGGFLAADVRARSPMQGDLDPVARAHGVGAQHAVGICLFHGAGHHGPGLGEFPADVDVAPLRADRVGRQRAPFDQSVRGPPHDLAVLEGARLRFVGVADEVMRLDPLLGHERPLETGGEPGAAAPTEPRGLHLLDHGLTVHAQRLPQALISAALDPAGIGPGLGVAKVLREEGVFFRVDRMRETHQRYLSSRAGTFSGVTLSMKSLSMITGVAKPQAPRHSTSTTVKRPSGLVAPRSPQPVCSRSAFMVSSAPQSPQGDVVQTWMKWRPTGWV